ncbi:stalk domain-containing protein [Anaerotignum sp.]|uniref:stalk domain-containing protein n=1 Tax=Anaerotignum sp. TaxID=2039241 RepID=UPI002A90AF49|nr:stalk domain-containing protein [Anaerotignum sp.]MCI7658298.1 stalk domain-containing protein [Clostridia bacterium]MDY5415946.1 stalk domain-containing protein [Anaerotignum sp.]
MKKIILGSVLALSIAVPALAHPPITVYVDQQEVVFADQAPVIVEDRTLVPMRKIFEAMDTHVTWDEPSQTITSTRGSDVVTMTIGEKQVYKNGKGVYTMDVPAQIMQDRTMVPIRAVAVAFDANVAWDGINYIISISTDSANSGNISKQIHADDGTLLATISLSYTPLISNSTAANKINKNVYDQMSQKASVMTERLETAAKAAYTKDPSAFQPYYYMGTYQAKGESSDFASVVLEERTFMGGTETKTLSADTYNMKTGSDAALTDIVTDSKKEIETLVKKGFSAIIDQNPAAFYSDAKDRLDKNFDDVGFYLDKNAVVFYLNSGIIAPESAGVIAFSVPR